MSSDAAPAWRISVVHSFYRSDQPSGENELVLSEVEALRRAGYDVRLSRRDTDDTSRDRGFAMRAAATTATGLGPSPLDEIADHRADLVHVHNLFPNYGRTWTRDLDRPLVVTLHNYRPLCDVATFYRDGRVCTDCLTRPASGLVHGCYQDSRVATLPLTLSRRGVRRDLLQRADRLVVLSPTERDYYLRAGVPDEAMTEVPNFLPDELDGGAGPGGEPWLYAGRVTAIKGVDDLLRAWPDDVPLVVAGPADDLTAMQALARGKQVDFAGRLERAEVMARLRTSRGLVFPSRSPETFGLVYAEALAAGTPVLTTPPGAAAGFVRRDGTGLAVDRLTTDAVREAHERFADLRTTARASFEERYTERAHVAALTALYDSLLD
jgi:glycosyltransferase involved in cell wall biosynthesis